MNYSQTKEEKEMWSVKNIEKTGIKFYEDLSKKIKGAENGK